MVCLGHNTTSCGLGLDRPPPILENGGSPATLPAKTGTGKEVRPIRKGLKPGNIAPKSGIYTPSKGGAQVAISKGDRLPPTKAGGTFNLTTPTKK